MTDKLLAEWFWTDRWMGSSAFLLPQEPRGVYREMLTQAWRRGARLPNDHEAIRRATGTTVAEWRRCWPLLERYWKVEGDSLVNETQQEVYAEAKAACEGASRRGRAGALARAQALLKQKLGGARAVPEHKPPSPSPSPVNVYGSGNAREEPPPTSATPQQARDVALKVLGPPPDINPLVKGRRPELESECLRLTDEISKATGEFPETVLGKASGYRGSTKLNPAAIRDTRLLHTVEALRRRRAELDESNDANSHLTPAQRRHFEGS